VTGSQHLSLQGGSVGSHVDLKYSDTVRDGLAPASSTVFRGDTKSFVTKGYVEEKHIYASTAQGGQVQNSWAVGQDHDFCGERYRRCTATQRHVVSDAPPAPAALRAEKEGFGARLAVHPHPPTPHLG